MIAKKILESSETYDEDYPTVSIDDAEKAMIEFAEHHVKQALKESVKNMRDGYVTDQDEEDILNCYPLTNIR